MALGLVGIILPVLPTTPFLLLSSYLFMKSSEKYYRWFISTWVYKKHLEEFDKNRSMTLKNKVIILSFATSMLVFAFIKMESRLMRLVIVILGLMKYFYFIFKIKTIKDEVDYV